MSAAAMPAALGALVVPAALTALVALAVADWLHPALDWEALADGPNHVLRVYAIHAALAAGDVYPRWLPDLYLGYGYPLLNYYAPATYYLAAALHALGLSIYGSLQWSGVLAAGAGGAGGYLLARAITGGRRDLAVLAAAVYVFSPYPFLTNLFVRAAVPEALALGMLPWLLYAALNTWRRGGAWPALLAGTLALVFLTHNISTLIFGGLLVVWLAYVVVSWPARGRADLSRRGTRTLGAVAIGVALPAFFWVPALLEARHVQLDLARGGIYDFGTWLFDPFRAAGATAQAGYPHAPAGPADTSAAFDYSALGKAVPEKVSLAQLALWSVTLVAALGALVAGPATGRRAARHALFWAAVAGACWLPATTWSRPLWEHVPLLSLVQFPWRFYGPLALCLALAAAAAAGALGRWRNQGAGAPGGAPRVMRAMRAVRMVWVGRVALAALTLALGYGSLAARPLPLAAEPAHDVDERDLIAREYNRYGAGTTSGGEFLPRTVAWPVEHATRRGIKVYDDAFPQAGWQAGLARITAGRAGITQVYRDRNGVAVDVVVEGDRAAQVAFHQLAFPGWRGTLDGRPAAVDVARYEPLDASLGFMMVTVPPGQHRVEVRFGPTRPRLAGNAVSAAAAMLGALWVATGLRRRFAGAASGTRWAPPWRLERMLFAPATVAGLAALAAGCAVAGAEAGARPRERYAAEAHRIALDVIGRVQTGEAQTLAPVGRGGGALPPFVEVQYTRVFGEERRWLYMHPPAAAAVRLTVPENAYFQAGLALDPRTWHESAGDGVRFIVEAETRSGRRTLLDRHVNPRARGEDRGWIDVWVDLDDLAGEEVQLVLRTDAADDAAYDWAGWANPQVVVWRAARPHPGTPHRW